MAQIEDTMSKKQVITATPKVAAEFIKLFGPPPLFRTEDNAIFNAILEGLAEEEKPRSFIARKRRAMSRRKRAMRMFEAISIVTPFLSREIKGS